MKKTHSSFSATPGFLARAIIVIAILGGLLLTYKTNPTQASVQPPGGDGVESIYVDNVQGSDTLGDGSKEKPFATIYKGNYRANVSGAPLVRLYVKGTGRAYRLNNDIYPKRNSMEFGACDNRPMVAGDPKADYLYLFDVQNYAGILFKDFDMVDVGIKVRGGMNVVIENISVRVTNPKLMSDKNDGAVLSVGIWDDTSEGAYINEGITIRNNKFAVTQKGTELIGLRLESIISSQIINNVFSSYDPVAVVWASDASGVDYTHNRYSDPRQTKPVYFFDKTDSSRVFGQM